MKSLQFQINRCVNLKSVSHASTRRQYKKSCKKFAEFCKEIGMRDIENIDKDTIQQFNDYLIAEGYSPSTIHRHITVACKTIKIRSDKIVKVKRTSNCITKSRTTGKNLQGRREQKKEEYKRLVNFQNKVGIRRGELERLRFDCLMEDESGYKCVRVVKGKGGKEQFQRILPDDLELVSSIVHETKGFKVFSALEMNNKIDLHKMRADHAKECYQYYLAKIKNDELYREQLKSELLLRYDICHCHEDRATEQARNRFLVEMQGKYKIRGNNRDIAEEHGYSITYDRTALMAVSVFHLSHWRNDVTVTNYILSW